MRVAKDIVHATTVVIVINFARGCRSFDNLIELVPHFLTKTRGVISNTCISHHMYNDIFLYFIN